MMTLMSYQRLKLDKGDSDIEFDDVDELPEVKVGEGDAGAGNVALAPATGHTVQPVHVDTIATPEGSREDHAVVGLGHPPGVAGVGTKVKAGLPPVLLHPDVGLLVVLEVGDKEGPVGVDGAPVLRAEHVGVHVEGIVLATAAVAVVPVAGTAVAGVQRAGDRVLVRLQGVVLGTPLSTNKIGITVPVSALSAPGAGHVNKVAGSIAVATNIAEVKGV